MTTHLTQIPSTSTRHAHRHRILHTAVIVVAASALLPVTSAAAEPPPNPRVTHCSAAFALTAVTDLGPPYDTWAQGIDANNNGYVCVRPFNDAASAALAPRFNVPPGSPIYLVGDDNLP